MDKGPDLQPVTEQYTDRYKNYVLLLLSGVYIFNFIDRQILVILQESIKADLGLSDSQLGLLTGFAFAVFYVTLGIPIARLADKSNRRNIIALALTIWSLMTALSGFTVNYIQLLLARIGVGVGEAGASPPAHSMISDYFPEERRATALSIYSMGIYIGILLGYLFGGWLDEYFGWRIALMVLGVPGILYAIFFLFTVKEPPRGYSSKIAEKNVQSSSLSDVIGLLSSRTTFILLALATGTHSFVVYGLGNWLPSFLARMHDMGSGEIGTWLSLGSGGAGALGVWLGGYLGDRYGRKDKRWYLWLPALAIALSIPLSLVMLFSSHKYLVLCTIPLVKVLWSVYLGPSIAMAHGMVGIRMRAMASAVLFLFLNFIGLGLGPLLIGMVSDYLSPEYGTTSLRWAMFIALLMSVIGVGLFYAAAKTLRKDIARAPL